MTLKGMEPQTVKTVHAQTPERGSLTGASQREGDPIKEIIQRSYMPQLRPSTVINQYINI